MRIGFIGDGQVPVIQDLPGLYRKMRPKFVNKTYAGLGTAVEKAI